MGKRRRKTVREEMDRISSKTVGEEDRISKLPDDLIHRVLSCLDSRVAVQTSLLSKRWVYLWTTLPCLNFLLNPFNTISIYRISNYSEFVTNFLNNRNQQSVISTININSNPENAKILDYALSNYVENLRIHNVDFKNCPSMNSAFVKTLRLTNCQNVNPKGWDVPNLNSLFFKDVDFGNRISGFRNLKELTLIGYTVNQIYTISCPNLQSLALYPNFSHFTFVVSAPNLLYFKVRSSHVPRFSAGDGFPGIKEVDIHIEITDYCWGFYKNDRIKRTMKNFNNMLNAVRGTPLLKLSSETIQVLRRIPDLSEYQPSPLGNLKFLYLRGPDLYEKPTMSTDHVIKYLLTNSPSAEILKA